MTKLLNLVIAGLVAGSVYALLSLGVVLIYRVSRVVNLAHGAMGVLATYVFFYVFVEAFGLPVLVAFVLTLVVGAAIGAGVQVLFIAPARSEGTLTTLIMTVGVLLVLTEATVQVWGSNQPVIPSIFSDRSISIGGTGVTVHQLGTAAIALVLGLGLSLLLNGTRYGTAIEAIAEDPGAARAVGLPVVGITLATWALGGATAALAGMLFIHLNSLDPISLTFVLIPALVAAVLGGFTSFALAAAGSVAIGVTFSLAQGYVTTSGVANGVVFAVLLAVLLLRRSAALDAHAEPAVEL